MNEWAYGAEERAAIYRAIAERRDMRHFSGGEIAPELLTRLLQAAHQAPSVGLMQPWRFLRITRPALREAIAGLVEEERQLTADALGERRDDFLRLKVEGVREGDVPVDEAKREIAEKQLKEAQANDAAKAAAEKALAELTQGGSLEALETRLPAQKTAGGDKPQAPVVRETRPFGRGDSPLVGLDNSELVKTAFELSLENSLPAAPIKAGESWVVFKLTEREQADKAAFAGAEEARLTDALLRRKRQEILEGYVRELRKRADGEGAVSINPEAVRYSASEETASL